MMTARRVAKGCREASARTVSARVDTTATAPGSTTTATGAAKNGARTMGWIERVEPCQHPDRPTPTTRDVGRIWECDKCSQRWKVTVVHYGHDVMPGEPESEAKWQVTHA